MKNNKLLITLLSVFLFSLAGCDKLPKAKHSIGKSGTEWNVEIEVLLKGGGSAVLICPKFTGEPRGAHGRECYIDKYTKAN